MPIGRVNRPYRTRYEQQHDCNLNQNNHAVEIGRFLDADYQQGRYDENDEYCGRLNTAVAWDKVDGSVPNA